MNTTDLERMLEASIVLVEQEKRITALLSENAILKARLRVVDNRYARALQPKKYIYE